MSKTISKKAIFLIIGTSSLILGTMIYLVFRERAYITQLLLPNVSLLQWEQKLKWLDNDFIKFYFPDYLWALSLSCWLHIIFKPKTVGSIVCTATVFLFGTGYEVFQHIGIVTGTGDFLDACLYLSAGITTNILNLRGRNKK